MFLKFSIIHMLGTKLHKMSYAGIGVGLSWVSRNIFKSIPFAKWVQKLYTARLMDLITNPKPMKR